MNYHKIINDLAINKNPKGWSRTVGCTAGLKQYLIDQTGIKSENVVELIWLYINKTDPQCEFGKKRKFKNYIEGYWAGCGTKSVCQCSRINQSKQLQTYYENLSEDKKKHKLDAYKTTVMERYGVSNHMKSEEVLESIKQKNLEKYGVNWTLERSDVKEKIENTVMEKYGVTKPFQSDAIREKGLKTTMDRHGGLMVQARKAYRDQNYGKNPFEVESAKIQETLNKKYGLKRENIVERIQKTLLERYDTNNSARINWPLETKLIVDNKKLFLDKFKGSSIAQVSEELSISWGTARRLLIKYDPSFNPRSRSHYEDIISDYLLELGVEFKKNATILENNKQVDFYIESHKLAIEFNGLYWHSEKSGSKPRLYHYNKFKECEKLGIQLLTIWEDEWNNKTDLVKSKIRSLLKLNPKAKGARNYKIKEIKSKDARTLLEKNHIQGFIASQTAIGLFDGDNLKSVLMIDKKKKYHEIVRFCSDGTNIPGAFTRLLKYWLKTAKFDKLISFSDNSYSNGNLYRNSGFTLEEVLKPGYHITDYEFRYRREHFMKAKIKNKYPEIYSESKTEREMTFELGFDRIWDCGNKRWVLKL